MEFDAIGYWSEIKHEIIKSYAAEYSRIMNAQRSKGFSYYYIDAFSGPGKCISEESGELVHGSPLHALEIEPKYDHYFFIDLDGDKIKTLNTFVKDRDDVSCFVGDCNNILINNIFPQIKWQCFHRALCILDPYGLHLNWEVIREAGLNKCIDIFLNFPIMDINRNVIWRNYEKVPKKQKDRLTAYWGDASWSEVAYVATSQLDMLSERKEKVDNDIIAEAFRKRLHSEALFKHVPNPIPMRNTINATIYYLFFASHKPVAQRIVEYIFNNYRDYQGG